MLIGRVIDTFDIRGRGLVVVLDMPEGSPGRNVYPKVGESLEIRRGDEVLARTTITGIELSSPPPPKDRAGFLFGGITKADVPIGAEVWTVE